MTQQLSTRSTFVKILNSLAQLTLQQRWGDQRERQLHAEVVHDHGERGHAPAYPIETEAQGPDGASNLLPTTRPRAPEDRVPGFTDFSPGERAGVTSQPHGPKSL